MNLNKNSELSIPSDPTLISPTQLMTNPKCKFELGGRVVYDIEADIKTENFIIPANSPFGLKKILIPSHYTLELPKDPSLLKFNSKFECGNLAKAIKLSDYEYDLYTRSDTGNIEQNHWYYFSVQNPRKTSITFNICNLKKSDPLYMCGMKPCIWSCKAKEFENQEWHRSETCVNYFLKDNGTYTLKFTYKFKYSEDIVYFAYSQPYSYSELQEYLKTISSQHKEILRIDQLCLSNDGKDCSLLTITDSIQDYIDYETETKDMNDMARCIRRFRKPKNGFGKKTPDKHCHKKAIVLMARVHSGETVSSFMMLGAIEYLLSSCTTAFFLRKNFIFKIIPMLNPDGVYFGNYRCCLKGTDLNRKWLRPDKISSPTIYHAKLMVFALAVRHDVKLVCDFHGHTKKKSVFMYGCSVKPYNYEDMRNNLLARVTPYYMYKRNKFFSFRLSHYHVEKYKESTSRIVFFKELQIPHCYTMEASFFGPEGSNSHFSVQDLQTLGKDLCRFSTVFIKNSFYHRAIADTNNYLRNLRVKAFMQKYPDKNTKGHIEIPLTIIPDKNNEIYKKEIGDKKIIPNENLLNNNVKLEKIEEIIENDDDNDNEKTEDNDNSNFWEQVNIVPCLPDANSSGSDSEDCNEIGNDDEKIENNVVEYIVTTPNAKNVDLEKNIKIMKNEKLLSNRNNCVTKNEQCLVTSWNKKTNESLVLQTFRFPEMEVEIKNIKHFEPLRTSIGVRTYRHRVSKSLNLGKNSLRFLPALNNFSKSGDTNKITALIAFQGIMEPISKIVSFGNSFQHRK
ncbi:hypothetical protein SteCoe_35954 [Stentor coeruleus]|uniref:Peptidase M14 domain-containing protein n=1 Tax=Stentor coeruleus TaxID=5963 RepID=A0A1R2AR68_9CILI|nr:hypothetical protein SteCoe_35954 [Stentor coeruleus]